MSNENMEALARRAVASKHWRWMRGMTDTAGATVVLVSNRTITVATRDGDGVYDRPDDGFWLPDLSDPATLGCLLRLVREAWGDDGATTQDRRLGNQGWWVWLSDPQKFNTPVRNAETEAEALVAALEAAP